MALLGSIAAEVVPCIEKEARLTRRFLAKTVETNIIRA
jgi:hypothetical protein